MNGDLTIERCVICGRGVKRVNNIPFHIELDTTHPPMLPFSQDTEHKIATEQLSYIHLQETESKYEIIMQFDGGGIMIKIDKTDNSQIVSGKLRYFAELIQRSIAKRSS